MFDNMIERMIEGKLFRLTNFVNFYVEILKIYVIQNTFI